jgi:hypothetical protein
MAAMQRQRPADPPCHDGRAARHVIRVPVRESPRRDWPLDASAELEVSRDVELLLELLELQQREAMTPSRWRLPAVSPLMMRNTWLPRLCQNMYLCQLEKLNSTLNRLPDKF